MAIKHAFTSAKDDGADETLVRPSNWNADHEGQPASISDFLDDTAGGTDALTTKAPTSNVVYDHGVATTGVHGAGSNYLALFGAASTVVSRVVLIDNPSATVTDESRTTDLAYTDLDLTAATSATAKMVILYIRFVAADAGTGGYNDVRIRKNGDAFNNPAVYIGGAAIFDGANACATVIVGLDAGQVMEYCIDCATGGVVLHTYIYVMGYIE